MRRSGGERDQTDGQKSLQGEGLVELEKPALGREGGGLSVDRDLPGGSGPWVRDQEGDSSLRPRYRRGGLHPGNPWGLQRPRGMEVTF